MKIGIGADTGDFEKGSKKIKQALKELGIDASSTAGSIIASMGKASVAFAAVFTAVKTVINAVKDLKDQNQFLGDSFNRAWAGMTASIDTFKTSLASVNFDNFISNLSEANRLARDLYDAADAMGEIGTAYNIALAQQLGTIDELRLKMKDTSLSEKERVKAGEDLLEIYEKLEKNPTRGLARVSDTTIDYYMQRMGVVMKGRTEEQLEQMRKYYLEFFKWLGTSQGEAFLEAAETVNKRGGINSNAGQTMISNAAYKGLAEYARLAIQYSAKMGDKDREKLEQAVVAYYQQENKYAQETFKIRKDIQSIQNEAAKAGEAAAKTAATAAEAELAAEKERMNLMARGLMMQGWANAVSAPGAITSRAVVQVPTELAEPDNVEAWRWDVVASIGDIYVGIKFEADTKKLIDITREVESAMNSIAVTTGEVIGELIGDLATGGDAWGNFKNAALSAFGDMATAVGKMAIATGVTTLGIKAALESLNGYAAIAAGVALVALGAAVKAGLSNVASGNYSASAGVATSSYSSYNTDYATREVNVNVTGTLKADGDQLVAVITNTQNNSYYQT